MYHILSFTINSYFISIKLVILPQYGFFYLNYYFYSLLYFNFTLLALWIYIPIYTAWIWRSNPQLSTICIFHNKSSDSQKKHFWINYTSCLKTTVIGTCKQKLREIDFPKLRSQYFLFRGRMLHVKHFDGSRTPQSLSYTRTKRNGFARSPAWNKIIQTIACNLQ